MVQITGSKGSRLIAVLLSVCIFITCIPPIPAKAGGWMDNPGNYDIQMADRIAGNGSSISITNHEYGQSVMFTPMMKGEAVELLYSMPSNGAASLTVYSMDGLRDAFPYNEVLLSEEFIPTEEEWNELKHSKARLGSLVGYNTTKYYENTVPATEGNNPVYVPATGFETMAAIKADMKSKNSRKLIEFRKMNHVPTVGMDGKGPGWYTLQDYYAMRGISLFSDTLQSVSLTVSGNSVSGNDLQQPDSRENATVSSGNRKEPAMEDILCKPLDSLIPDGMDESMIPEDFYVNRNYLASFTAAGAGSRMMRAVTRAVSTPLYNCVLWRGRYWDDSLGLSEEKPDGIPEEIWQQSCEKAYKVLQPGKYLIAVEYVTGTSSATYRNTRFIPVEIVSSMSGSDHPTEGEIISTLLTRYNMDISAGTGFPSVANVAWGDPVNLLSGSLEWSYTDLQMEGACPLGFTRTYDSGQAENQKAGLGNGWSHNYAYHMDLMGNMALVTLPGGGRLVYTKEMNGAFEPVQKGCSYSLNMTPEGTLLQNENGTGVLFDGTGCAVSIKGADGNTTALTYQDGKLATVKNGDNVLTFTWNGACMTGVSDNSDRKVSFTYRGTDLTGVTNADGDELVYTYDEAHNLLTLTDFNQTLLMTNTYDGEHRVTTQTMAGEETTEFIYDGDKRENTFRKKNGMYSTIRYDENGRIVSEANNDGTTTYAYDECNRRIQETDKNGSTYAYAYDGESSRVLAVTYPDETQEAYTYNERGQVLTHTDRTGAVTAYTYDEKGHLSVMTDPNGNTQTFLYDEKGYPLSATDRMGSVVTYTTDANGNILTETDREGRTITMEYDSAGRMTARITPEGSRYSYSYSAAGKPVSETDPEGNTTTYTYNGNGYRTGMTNPAGDSSLYTYTGWNRMTQETDYAGEKTVYSYDSNGNLTVATDADGGKVTYTYDAMGRVTAVTDGEGNTITCAYDKNGNLLTETAPDGGVTTYTYDTDNRMLSETDGNGSKKALTYDGNGRILTATDGNGGMTAYTYDKNGNCLTKTDADGGVTTYTYDKNGSCLTVTTPMGALWKYTYDIRGNLLTTTNPEGGVTACTYDKDSRLTSVTDPEGNTTSYTYDKAGRLTGQTCADDSRAAYTYDKLGNLLTRTDGRENQVTFTYDKNSRLTCVTDGEGNTISYTYSKAGRLLGVKDAEDGVTAYTYDKNGNCLTQTDGNGGVTAYTYDSRNRLLSVTTPEGNTTAYTYDKAGNLVSVTLPEGGRTSTEYDHNNQAVKETDALSYTKEYTYDKRGNLTSFLNERGCKTAYVYDADNRLSSVTDALGHTTSYTYDGLGNVILITYADDSTDRNSYDKNGNVAGSTDGTGAESTYTCDSMGRVVQQTDAAGGITSCEYDANGNLVKTTNPVGAVTSYAYDKNNRPVQVTDGNGGTVSYTYTGNGRVSAQTDAMGGVTAYTYDGNGNVAAITDAMGYTVSYEYDKDNRPVKAVDAKGGMTVYTYDKNGNLITVENPDGGVVTYVYDKKDRLIQETDPEGGSLSYTYDGCDNLTILTDALNRQTKTEYDALNRAVKTTYPDETAITCEYDSMGRVIRAVNEDGAVTEYAYDGAGHMIRIQDALGNSRSYTYDGNGKVTGITDEDENTTVYEYDAAGRLVKETDSLGNAATYAYDANSNLIKTTDKRGNATVYTYDANNRLCTMTDALDNTVTFAYDKKGNIVSYTDGKGGVTKYTLDKNGNIIRQTDAAGHDSCFSYDSMNRPVKTTLYNGREDGEGTESQVTLYRYDKRGLLITRVNALGGIRSMTYDAAGNLITETDEDGYETVHDYNERNRLSQTIYGDGQQVSYVYNGTGELTYLTDANGTTGFDRDLLNRLTAVTDHKDRVTGYEWDKTGNLTAITYPNGDKATYTYDSEHNQTVVTDWEGQEFTFTHDENGNLTSKRYANGEMERYGYDALNRRVRMDEYDLQGTQKTYTTYGYDANGNRTATCTRVPTTPVKNWEKTDNTGTWGGKNMTYTYDVMDRLVKEYDNEQQLTTSYTYDFLGNRLSKEDSTGLVIYEYNERNQLVKSSTATGNMAYAYDGRGNRLSEVPDKEQENYRTYKWDAAGRLVFGTRGTEWNSYVSRYAYNGLGQRINSTIMGPDKTVYDRDYIIDYTGEEYNDLTEYNMGHYQWQGDKPVQDLNHLYSADGTRLETDADRYNTWSNETVTYRLNVHEDIMGSGTYYTRQSNGYISNKHEYDAYGFNTKAPTYNYDPEYRSTEPYFTGHPYDGALNLYYAHNRFYDAKTGQWLSEDPAEDGSNWYAYCNNNPISCVDVLGLYGVMNEPAPTTTRTPYAAALQSSLSDSRTKLDISKQKTEWLAEAEAYTDKNKDKEKQYFYVMNGSTGNWLLGLWKTGNPVLDNLQHKAFVKHVNFVGNAAEKEAKRQAEFQQRAYESLQNGSWKWLVDVADRNPVRIGDLTSLYRLKYKLNGNWKESSELARQSASENWPTYFANIAGVLNNTVVWNVDKVKAIYQSAVSEWDSHPMMQTAKLAYPIYAESITSGMEDIMTVATIIYGSDRQTAKTAGRIIGEIAIDVAATLITEGIAKGAGKLIPKVKTELGIGNTVNPKDVNFMQSSIRNQTGKYTVLDNAEALRDGTLKVSDLPEIRVWQDTDGKLWTLDHRRLAAFRMAELDNVPVKWATTEEIANEMWKMTTKTEGKTIKLKIGAGKSSIIE